MITLTEIEQLTLERGEGWAHPHARRLLALVDQVAGNMAYQRDWLAYAAYLHDWGAFPCYRQPGVDHALLSKEIAEREILPDTGLSTGAISAILAAIELHDYRDRRPTACPEALLLREADMLDFLGALGVAREFAWGPNNLRKVVARIHARMDGIRGRFTLPVAQVMAEQRLNEMEALLAQLDQESFGFL